MNIDLSFRDLPITSYDDLNRAIRMLLGSHPLLAPLTDHIPACEIDYYSLFGTGDEPDNDGDLMFKNGDWMDAVTHTVNVLVSFNNDRWNFAPGGAPPRIDPNDARLVAKCLYTAEGLKDAQVTSNGLAVLCSGEGTPPDGAQSLPRASGALQD